MKKVFISLFISLVAVAAICAFSPKQKITGLVHIYGSEPHTYVGFVTDEGKQYSLEVAKDSDVTLQQLQAMQGIHLELAGQLKKKTKGSAPGFMELKDGTFFVQTASEIKK
jgi:hypothetical protein